MIKYEFGQYCLHKWVNKPTPLLSFTYKVKYANVSRLVS